MERRELYRWSKSSWKTIMSLLGLQTESGQSHPATPATSVQEKISQEISWKIVTKLLSRTYEEISTGSFVHMEKNITATHVMFHSASKSLLEKLKKLQNEIITKLQVVFITLMKNVPWWRRNKRKIQKKLVSFLPYTTHTKCVTIMPEDIQIALQYI